MILQLTRYTLTTCDALHQHISVCSALKLRIYFCVSTPSCYLFSLPSNQAPQLFFRMKVFKERIMHRSRIIEIPICPCNSFPTIVTFLLKNRHFAPSFRHFSAGLFFCIYGTKLRLYVRIFANDKR